MELIKNIDDLLKRKDKIFIAIEGSCGSGKTTLAEYLKKQYNAIVLQTDDYFLPAYRKTQDRLNVPGGNIDFERMKKEVFDQLDKKELFVRKYDCNDEVLRHKTKIQLSTVNIVEGVYSSHPYFEFKYDLTVFIDIDKEKQLKRLEARNSALLDRFINEWIPLEDRYFDYYNIRNNANIIITLESSDLIWK